jgi:hypothetical protein
MTLTDEQPPENRIQASNKKNNQVKGGKYFMTILLENYGTI